MLALNRPPGHATNNDVKKTKNISVISHSFSVLARTFSRLARACGVLARILEGLHRRRSARGRARACGTITKRRREAYR